MTGIPGLASDFRSVCRRRWIPDKQVSMPSRSQADEVAELRALIRSAGLRSTAARIEVLQRLRRARSPLTHAEIAEDLVPRGFDKATVFRNLVDLTEAELVSRTELGDHVWRYELRDRDDPDKGKHPHFVCVDCGGVTCLSDIEFNAATRARAAKVGRVTEVLLKGHCLQCEAQA